MLKLKRPVDERGISVILAAALVIAIFITAISAFLVIWAPGEIGRREHEHMQSVEGSLLGLKTLIEGLQVGQSGTIYLDMSANPIPIIPFPNLAGTLSIFPDNLHTNNIYPTADAYVVEKSPNDNFGLENLLRVASRCDNNNSRAFLKFSLENIPMGVMIYRAKLWLYCYDYKSPLMGVTDLQCRPVENDIYDNWIEKNITWGNQPPAENALDSFYVDTVGWISLTVKDFVAQEVTGDRIVSLELNIEQENYDNIGRSISFYSKDNRDKEAGSKRPYLEVVYTRGPPLWRQTDWVGGPTISVPESNKWPEGYNRYYESENENTKTAGEIRLENLTSLEYGWRQDTKIEFENGSLRENLDTENSPGDVVLASSTVTFGDITNNKAVQPWANYTYVQRLDPAGQYAAPYNGVIIQWRWNPEDTTTSGARFKIFRHVSGTVWNMIGESKPVNLKAGLNTFGENSFPDNIPIRVKAGDRIGMYSGSSRTYYSDTSGYSVSRTEGDIHGTSSFTEHLYTRRLPIEATLKYYRYSGTLTSQVYDTKGSDTNWRTISWGENLPPGTDITLQTRTGSTPTPDNENWSDWSPPYTNPAGELITSPRWIKRSYIQYKVNFLTNETALTPALKWVEIRYITSAEYKPSGWLESSVYDAGSSVHWENITWEAETPSITGENKSVDNELDPLVDWSPLIGENLSPLENARTRDNIYENIAEELRSPWWNRSWACRRLVTINNENNPNALENYQVKIDVKYDDNMLRNFDDLRFVDNDNVTALSYWIENYNLGDNAVVWVRVPKIPANDNKMIYMYYGNPGASPGSNFSATFPKSLIIDGTTATLGGVQRYDWVEIRNGGILIVQSENMLQLFARKIIVDSTSRIDATGGGYLGGPTNRLRGQQENGWSYDNRPGTGGGRGGYALITSDGPGGGGGGYGGSGGKGGGAQGSNDYPGDNGSTFGSENDNGIYMGSGGGSGGLSQSAPQNNAWNVGGAGGAGGGSIRLNAGIIETSGLVSVDGGAGAGGMSNTSGAGNGGGGGGSGGTILIEGNQIIITGELSARGGTGGARSRYDPDPSVPAPDGGAGGGGGGGRIKVFYSKSLDNASAIENVEGGASGGPSYENDGENYREDRRGAQHGKNGTIYPPQKISYKEPTASVGSSKELELENRGQQGYHLNLEHRITGVKLGYDNYAIHIWGYSENDENIGVYIWSSKMGSWSFIDNLPKSPENSITENIRPRDLDDYLVGDNLSIGYFDNAGDSTRTVIHIDYCALECIGHFSTEVKVYTRSGDNANPSSWLDNSWHEAENNSEVPSPNSRYLQYRVEENTQNGKLSPVFKEIIINFIGGPEYGTIGFESRNLFYPSQKYVYEGGALILVQDGVDVMLSKPTMIAVSDAENNNIRVDVNFLMVENKNEITSLNSTGIGTIEVYCKNSVYTVTPVSGPNRENIALTVMSSYQNAWMGYLQGLREELRAMNIYATPPSLYGDTLTMTIMGRDNRLGVNDIYYYEKITEIEVTFS